MRRYADRFVYLTDLQHQVIAGGLRNLKSDAMEINRPKSGQLGMQIVNAGDESCKSIGALSVSGLRVLLARSFISDSHLHFRDNAAG
jgi:hypothetical protein